MDDQPTSGDRWEPTTANPPGQAPQEGAPGDDCGGSNDGLVGGGDDT